MKNKLKIYSLSDLFSILFSDITFGFFSIYPQRSLRNHKELQGPSLKGSVICKVIVSLVAVQCVLKNNEEKKDFS